MIRCKVIRLPYISRLRSWILTLLSTSLAAGSVITTPSAFGQPIVFEDGEFESSDWQDTTFAASELGDHYHSVTTRLVEGGNPDAYLRPYFHVEPPNFEARGAPVVTFSRKVSTSVDPAEVGGIAFINYSEDSRLESGGTVEQESGPALIQEGHDGIQRVFIAASLSANSSGWARRSLSQLTNRDFIWVKGGTSLDFYDDSVLPDFSTAGKPIGLGFFRRVRARSNTSSFPAGIDNWRIEVQSGSPNNLRPIALVSPVEPIGRDFTGIVTLSASSSYDLDNGPSPLTYTWRQIAGPPVVLEASDSSVQFTAVPNDLPCGEQYYVFGLVVSDGSLVSEEVKAYVWQFERTRCAGDEEPDELGRCTLWKLFWLIKRIFGKGPNSRSAASVILDTAFLPTYRALRDQVLAPTLEGQRAIGLLQYHTNEIIQLFQTDPRLAFTLAITLSAIQPVFQSLLADKVATIALTQSQTVALNTMMDALAAPPASPALREAIAAERTKWGPLENYIGRSATEIQQALLGYGAYLPRITSASTLVLTNPTTDETRAKVDWTDQTGQIVASIEKTLSPQGVTVAAAPSANFTGSARVLSDRLVRAFVVNRGTDGGVIDTYEGTVPGKRVTVPLFRQPGAAGAGAALTVYNIDATSPAEVTMGHRDERGTDRGTKTVTIPPLGSHTFDAKPINGKIKGASVAVLSSTKPVVASQQSTFKGSRAMLPAVAESKECTSCTLGLVPFGPSKGSGQRADIYVHNRGTVEATVTLTYFDPKGIKRATQQQKIPAFGLARLDTSKAVRRGRPLTGYVQVTQSGEAQRLAVQWLMRNGKDSRPIGFNAIGATSGASTWACVDSQRGKNERQRPLTRLAILNPTTTDDQATVELYDAESGQKLATQTVQLPAGSLVELGLGTVAYRQAGIGFAVIRSANQSALIINSLLRGSRETRKASCQPLM